MPVMTFSPAFMATGLVCPADKKRIEWSVADEPGLFVECRASDRAVPTWYLRLKNAQGTNVYKRLGTIKEVSLTQARKMARQLKVEHGEALKQAPVQKPVLAEMQFDTFMAEHYFPYVKVHKRSWIRDDQLYRLRIKPKFGDARLCDITRYGVQQFQNHLATTGLSPASQDHHIKLLRRTLNLALEWEFIDRNVLKGVKLLNVDNQLHDVPTEVQLERLVSILRTDPNRPVCHIVMFLLCTGARLAEALNAKWNEVDLENGLWTIPAATAKSKKSRTVPLNDSAMWVLAEAKKVGQFDAVFANPATGKPFTTITRVWYRLRREAGIEKMRLHGARHFFAQMVVSSGRSLYDVQVLLGHADPRVSQRYAKLNMNTLREAAGTASLLVSAPKPEVPLQQAVIVPFPRAA